MQQEQCIKIHFDITDIFLCDSSSNILFILFTNSDGLLDFYFCRSVGQAPSLPASAIKGRDQWSNLHNELTPSIAEACCPPPVQPFRNMPQLLSANLPNPNRQVWTWCLDCGISILGWKSLLAALKWFAYYGSEPPDFDSFHSRSSAK